MSKGKNYDKISVLRARFQEGSPEEQRVLINLIVEMVLSVPQCRKVSLLRMLFDIARMETINNITDMALIALADFYLELDSHAERSALAVLAIRRLNVAQQNPLSHEDRRRLKDVVELGSPHYPYCGSFRRGGGAAHFANGGSGCYTSPDGIYHDCNNPNFTASSQAELTEKLMLTKNSHIALCRPTKSFSK